MQPRIGLALLLAVLATTVHAQNVYTVNSTLDDIDVDDSDSQCLTAAGTCTLRAAVMQANGVSGTDTRIVLPAGVYPLTVLPTGANGAESGDLNFTTPAIGDPTILLTGMGASSTTIDGNAIDRVISVAAGRKLVVSGLQVRGGYLAYESGAGILNAGTLFLFHSVLRDNLAGSGGGIANSGESATASAFIIDTQIIANRVLIQGGGIENDGQLYLIQSSVVGNGGQNNRNIAGGGIFNEVDATVFVEGTTFSGNAAEEGGAIYNLSGPVTVRNSTLSGNTAGRYGGAVFNYHVFGTALGAINIYNSSIIDNEADHDQYLDGRGGGLYNSGSATTNIRNTLLAGNYRSGAPIDDDCNGTVGVYGNNLFSSLEAIADCSFTGPGEVGGINSPALIGPLQNNGGPTLTHALLPGSNAIDGSDPVGGCVDEALNPLPTDQRGYPRVAGARCDVGAFEYGDTIFLDGFD